MLRNLALAAMLALELKVTSQGCSDQSLFYLPLERIVQVGLPQSRIWR